MNGNGNGTSKVGWIEWIQGVAEQGLAAKWDAEYMERFGVARQTPAVPVGEGAAGAVVPLAAPPLSPMFVIGGGLALIAAFYFLLKD